jgi:cullin 1
LDVEKSVIKSLVTMYRDLSLYPDYFETPFLKASRDYYQEKGQEMVRKLTPAEFLLYCEEQLAAEVERLECYLDMERTQEALLKAVEDHLIAEHIHQVLNEGKS